MRDAERLLDDLRTVDAPCAHDARRRAWAATAEAFAERSTPHDIAGPRRIGARWIVACALAVVAVATLGALTPPGSAVADWVRRVVDPPPAPRVTAPATLPGQGRALIVGERGLRIVTRVGAGPSLGRWDGATWSPQARFLAVWRGSELAALAPDGGRRWTIAAPARVSGALWSPEGFHVAYVSGRAVRIVAGNGLRDRLWRARVAPVVPAFRPTARRTLAWLRADGRIPVADVFTGAVRALSGRRLGRGASALAWSGDGRRLAVLAPREVRIWNVRRGAVRTIALDGRGAALAAAPTRTRFAVLTHDKRRGTSAVTLIGARRTTVRVRGHLRDLAFSPDGRTLIATWPATRRWLVLGTGGETLATTPTIHARPGRLTGWCCR